MKKSLIKQRNQIPIILNRDEEILWVYGLAKSKAVIDQKDLGDIYLVCEEMTYDK